MRGRLKFNNLLIHRWEQDFFKKVQKFYEAILEKIAVEGSSCHLHVSLFQAFSYSELLKCKSLIEPPYYNPEYKTT